MTKLEIKDLLVGEASELDEENNVVVHNVYASVDSTGATLYTQSQNTLISVCDIDAEGLVKLYSVFINLYKEDIFMGSSIDGMNKRKYN
jgi:hypothetical protein